jgi:glycosyltransferase involved in cell wall biosynthesis
MVHYTVLVPARDAADAVARLLPQLDGVLAALLLPYEILCVDDGSQSSAWRALEACRAGHPRLRLLRFDRPRGTSAALTAGLAASRGELVVGLSAEPCFELRLIPHLISRLSQYDLVVGEPERSLWQCATTPLRHLSRLLANERRRPCGRELFFAARREAVSRLGLIRRASSFLPAIVEHRGFRVCRMTIAEGLPPRGEQFRASWVERLAARWFDRHFEPHLASEPPSAPAAARLPLSARADAARARYVGPAALSPQQQGDNSA